MEQVAAMYESQRQAAAGIDYVLTRRKNRQRLLLLDMDGTVTPDHDDATVALGNDLSGSSAFYTTISIMVFALGYLLPDEEVQGLNRHP